MVDQAQYDEAKKAYKEVIASLPPEQQAAVEKFVELSNAKAAEEAISLQ